MKRLLAVVLVVAACGGMDGPVDSSPVRSIDLTLSAYQIEVGSTTQGQAAMFDAQGIPVADRSPTWKSLTPSIVSVNSSGVITGLQAGIGSVRASSGAATGEAQVLVTNPHAGSITLSRDTATVFVPNGSVQLISVVRDADGNSITNPTILWQSSAPLIAVVNSTGLVTGIAVGSTTIRASIDSRVAQATITVLATPNVNAPQIVAINPALLRPGGTYTMVGNNFAPTAAGNVVVVDGVAAIVNQATVNGISVTLPVAGFTCEPSRTVFVQVTANGLVGGGSATLSAPNPRSLAPGQSVVISNANEVRCNELSTTGGRYVLSVYNAYRSAVVPGATGSAFVTVHGAVGGLTGGAIAAAQRQPVRTPWNGAVPRLGSVSYDVAEAIRRARERDQVHGRLLERNIEYLRAHAASFSAMRALPAEARRSLASASSAPIATIGAVTQVKVPNVDVANYCASNFVIGVRTVYVGQHAIIVEDTATTLNGKATLQGQMNSYFAQLGQEFDNVMWPILINSFGNPLALDAQLSGSGRVVMVFSPRVNTFQSGDVLGFAVTCDLTISSPPPSSNVGEYFYAIVPTDSASGYFPSGTRNSWLRLMRATVIHEVKHITAFAERIKAGFAVEDASWEEGMARNAEELYARTFYGTQARQNTGYSASIGCDLQFTNVNPPCANRPVLMMRHFDGLESYFLFPELYSPLGRTFTADQTIYASAWSIERWANDHFATSESQFLKDFTVSAATGVQNLEARTGRPWEEMLGEWSLGMYLDDESGFTPANTHLMMPSWNLHDIWRGLCNDLGPCNPNNSTQNYSRPIPFQPHPLSFGAFTVGESIVGGSFSIFELTGPQTGNQVIEIRSQSGGDPPPTIRLAIVRVQ